MQILRLQDDPRKKVNKIKSMNVKPEAEDKQILSGVDLSIGAGHVDAIMGPNSSGKSTLSDVLAGREGDAVTVLAELEDEAKRRGAGADIGVDLDCEVIGQNDFMLMVSASGTAVRLG